MPSPTHLDDDSSTNSSQVEKVFSDEEGRVLLRLFGLLKRRSRYDRMVLLHHRHMLLLLLRRVTIRPTVFLMRLLVVVMLMLLMMQFGRILNAAVNVLVTVIDGHVTVLQSRIDG